MFFSRQSLNKKSTGKHFIGVDPSLTETGVVIINDNGEALEERIIKTSPKDGIIERRFEIIMDDIDIIRKVIRTEVIYIEGLALNTKNAKKFEMGALHHFIRFMLYKECIPHKVIPPKVLKKWTTGNGNAGKDKMKESCYKRFGIKYENDNLCDAYCLAAMALDNYNKEVK